MNANELAAHVRELVDNAPELTDQQRDRLAVLLQQRPEEDAAKAA